MPIKCFVSVILTHSTVAYSLAITQPSETLSSFPTMIFWTNAPSCLDKLVVLLATRFNPEIDQNHLDKFIATLEDAISLSPRPNPIQIVDIQSPRLLLPSSLGILVKKTSLMHPGDRTSIDVKATIFESLCSIHCSQQKIRRN